jgi:hypothetical protein
MLRNPLLCYDGIPKNEKTKRQHRYDKPPNALTQQLMTLPIKVELFAVDFRMSYIPSLYHTVSPRRAKRQRKDRQQSREEANTNQPKQTTCKSRTRLNLHNSSNE